MANSAANNKRLAKNTVLLYFRMIFTMLVSLYTSRVVLNTLGVEDYGIYNIAGGFVWMFSFLNASMASATQRFLTFELGRGDFCKLQKIFSTSINIHLIIAAIILIVAETIGLWFIYSYLIIPAERFSAALWVYQFSILIMMVIIISVPYNALIIAHEKMSAFAYISVLEVILKLLIVYLLVVIDYDKLKIYAVLMFLIQVVIRGIYGRYCNKHFAETKYIRIRDRQQMKEMMRFAGWNLFGNFASITLTQGVNILLNIFFGPAINAARGLAVQVQHAVSMFYTNFQLAFNPQIIKSYSLGEKDRMNFLLLWESKLSFSLVLIIVLPIILETDTILHWWLKTVPSYTSTFVQIILCVSIIDALSNPLMTAAQANGNIRKYQITVSSVLLMILPVSYIVLKMGYPPYSVFIVHFVLTIAAYCTRIVLVKPLIGLSIKNYLKNVILPVIIIIVLSPVIPVIIKMYFLSEGIYGFIAVIIGSTFSSIITVWCFGFNRFERKRIKEIILNQIKKVHR